MSLLLALRRNVFETSRNAVSAARATFIHHLLMYHWHGRYSHADLNALSFWTVNVTDSLTHRLAFLCYLAARRHPPRKMDGLRILARRDFDRLSKFLEDGALHHPSDRPLSLLRATRTTDNEHLYHVVSANEETIV